MRKMFPYFFVLLFLGLAASEVDFVPNVLCTLPFFPRSLGPEEKFLFSFAWREGGGHSPPEDQGWNRDGGQSAEALPAGGGSFMEKQTSPS